MRLCRPRAFLLGFAVYAAVFAAMWTQGTVASRETEASRSLPKPIRNEGFATSNSCRACHPDQYTSWHASYHRTMTQVASPDVIVAPFDGTELAAYGETGRVERRGDEFWVEMVDPEWEISVLSQGGDEGRRARAPHVNRQVLMTTGSHHFQVFWTRGRGTELWQFPWRWNLAEQRWMHRRDVFLTPPHADQGTEFRYWNNMCIDCHSVAGQPWGSLSGDSLTGARELSFNTRVAELGIACEACHGPSEAHVRANRDPVRRYGLHFSGEGDSTIVNPARKPHDVASQICGQCHGHYEYAGENRDTWYSTGRAYRAGDEIEQFLRFIQPTDDDPNIDGRYWADGNCRSAGREYSGMSASACFQQGELSCLSCHQMHQKRDDPRAAKQWGTDQLAVGMETNQACLSCHEKFADQDELEDHTKHLAKSSGSLCYNCHMPHTSYGLLTAMRSHRIDVPEITPLRSNARPNACNLCHLDQTLAWSARHLADWYGSPEVDLDDEEQTIAASVLWALRGDAGQRVITAWHMGWASAQQASGNEWIAPILAQLLDDPYSVVRFVSFRSMRSLPGFADFTNAYDSPPAERSAATAGALETWKRNRTGSSRRTAAQLLLDPSNELRTEAVHALLERRDNRPVGSIE
jgi:hypothetical protein